MATTRFHQINAFINKATLIVTELGQDCPAMIVSQNTALVAAVQAEDEAYRTITRSPLSDQIAEADQVRDNTFVGLRTMVEALGRVGTAAQKEAAPRVLQAMRDYQVNISEGYELESTHIAQLIQQLEVSPLADDCTTLAVTALVSQLKTENQQVQTLIAQRNEQQAGIDAQAMQRARQAADLVYVETVMVINAFAVVEQQQGVSPYDHAIDVVNQDQEYYVQQVFPRGVKKLKITANVYFSYYQGETRLLQLLPGRDLARGRGRGSAVERGLDGDGRRRGALPAAPTAGQAGRARGCRHEGGGRTVLAGGRGAGRRGCNAGHTRMRRPTPGPSPAEGGE